MWKNLGKKDRLKTVFGSQQNVKVMSSFFQLPTFLSRCLVLRCCVPAATFPPSGCLVFFGLPPTNHRQHLFVKVWYHVKIQKRRRSSKAVLDAYYQRPSAGGRRANAGFMFTRRSPDTHYRRPRHQQTHLVY